MAPWDPELRTWTGCPHSRHRRLEGQQRGSELLSMQLYYGATEDECSVQILGDGWGAFIVCLRQLRTLPGLCSLWSTKPAKCVHVHRRSVLSRGEQALMSACPHPDSSTRHQKPGKPQPACGRPSVTAIWILPSTVETPECHTAPDREEPQGVSRPSSCSIFSGATPKEGR